MYCNDYVKFFAICSQIQVDTVHLKCIIPHAAGATWGFCCRLIDLKIKKSQWKDSFWFKSDLNWVIRFWISM